MTVSQVPLTPAGSIALNSGHDPIHAEDIALVLSLMEQSMPFAYDLLVYHPTGETQVGICREEKDEFKNLGIGVILTSELYHGVDYSALNTGVACGVLQPGRASGNYSYDDIVVFQDIPNDISHVAGVITTIPANASITHQSESKAEWYSTCIHPAFY